MNKYTSVKWASHYRLGERHFETNVEKNVLVSGVLFVQSVDHTDVNESKLLTSNQRLPNVARPFNCRSFST